MRIKVKMPEFEYLKSILLKGKNDILKKLEMKIKGNSVEISLNELLENEIKDLAGKKLQKVGFNKDYEITPEGKILENLIDAFSEDQK